MVDRYEVWLILGHVYRLFALHFKESLKDKYDAVVSVGFECFTRALVSLHAFTGCDTVSAFAGLGK